MYRDYFKYEVLGIDKERYWETRPSNANLFLYMFRRFGCPLNGADEYKDYARWHLTTSKEDVWLTIYVGGTEYLWVYAPTYNTVEGVVREQLRTANDNWKRRAIDYFEKKGIILFDFNTFESDYFHCNGKMKEEYNQQIDLDFEKHKSEVEAYKKTKEFEIYNKDKEEYADWHAYCLFMENKVAKYYQEFETIEARPPWMRRVKDVKELEPYLSENTYQDLIKQDNAIKRALHDLMRPVYRRDVAITPIGEYDGRFNIPEIDRWGDRVYNEFDVPASPNQGAFDTVENYYKENGKPVEDEASEKSEEANAE
jgi:hypothetical protein